jgi:hypothetical protein
MTRTLAALLLTALALLAPGKAAAGPPEGPIGAMKLDKLAEGLRQYQHCRAEGQRVAWLKRLAPSCDCRVKAALLEALSDPSQQVTAPAAELLAQHYDRPLLPQPVFPPAPAFPPPGGFKGFGRVPVPAAAPMPLPAPPRPNGPPES